MPALQESELSPFSTRQLYRLVVDIASYPEFLPWCAAARVLSGSEEEIWREGGQQLAELTIQFKPFRESYVSRVTFYPPADEHAPCRVQADLERGPFKHLTNLWELTPVEGGGCRIDLSLDFHFRSVLLQKLVGTVFHLASQKMAAAFRARAVVKYAAKN